MKHKISEQPRATSLNKGDLAIVSQTLNPPYDTQWISRSVSFETLEKQIEALYRNDNFKDELDELYEISENYLNDQNLKIYFSSDNKIQLKNEAGAFSEIDASQFIAHGMLKNAYLDGNDLVIVFSLHDGTEKTVRVPLSKFVDTYEAGNGLCCVDRVFKIDEDIVSKVGHQHSYNEISDINDILELYQKKGNYLSSNALDQLSVNWQNAWSRISAASNGLTGDVGNIAYKNTLSTSDIEGYKETQYFAGNGLKLEGNTFSLSANVTSYEYVKNNLSNDGYCVMFRDYPEES